MPNLLTLAVAGSRKTQGLVEFCAGLPRERRALVVTYTQANQVELGRRLSLLAGDHHNIQVMGWFALLLRDFARPFIPFKFPQERVRGFNFDGRPHERAKGLRRFLDSAGAVYGCELSRLAFELIGATSGKLIRRLECMFDHILIDEVQDFAGYDWNILDALLSSSLDVRMVGDIRQSVLSTNPRASKNKQFAYAASVSWFREREARGVLRIEENSETWRCHPQIARFSDTIFAPAWGFAPTVSRNDLTTGHDGVFLVRRADVDEYIRRYSPRCLRDSVSSWKDLPLDFLNFRMAKGTTHERVLVAPTARIVKFVQSGRHLEPVPAAKFYVAVTRAKQSVAIILDEPGESKLPYWQPSS